MFMVEKAVIKEAKVWNSPADMTEIKVKDKCSAVPAETGFVCIM